ncbi:sodium-dependent transporter [Aliiglaciecola sp. M165]|uniref:sodium-dependent transporter n=1 Tax=Aliiglaciecola sp. M165 TaxID=2593649 RepID=UPI001180F09C|nr:sodium-dependent transporter [Aliiglaciecola sp. M165]TRY30836.1 sodium-dependent transporter [Aliiglaciecola sp. M165]
MSAVNKGRPHFASRIGFIFAAAGSAVGLGNIWGFPTQVANHGGGAFIIIYLLVMILLAVPALYAELSIGFIARANPVEALRDACRKHPTQKPLFGSVLGFVSLTAAIFMLGFYSILAGWMLAHSLGSVFSAIGWEKGVEFVTQNTVQRNLSFCLLVTSLTAGIIFAGVKRGIEAWSKRLMPLLLLLLGSLIIYVLFLPGAQQGLALFLRPDFDAFLQPKLYLAAMGQAFFSLSVGVGGMMIYGSYLRRDENLGRLTMTVAGLDTLVAFMAGLLIIPALFAAQSIGETIMSNGELIGRSQLIFDVLPRLFDSLGWFGNVVGFIFFTLLSIASITSTISSTEVPVSYLIESKKQSRNAAVLLVSITVLALSTLIVFNFELLFRAIIALLTHYTLPLMGLMYFVVIGWIRPWPSDLNNEGIFKTLLRLHIKYICPILMLCVFVSVM